MGFWTLFEVASMPIIQVLIVSILGAFLATDYCNLLPTDARKSLNKIVFMVFTPSLMFANLAQTVTLEDIVSWWFMPLNIGMTFLFGGILGWMVVKILKPEPHLQGLIIATSSAGNLGNLLLIIVPAICHEDGGPFGSHSVCSSVGLSYASFSMALGGFFIWTHTYQLMRTSAVKCKALGATTRTSSLEEISKTLNNDYDTHCETRLLQEQNQENITIVIPSTTKFVDQRIQKTSLWDKLKGILHQVFEELLAPPTLAAILGLIFGAAKWLKSLIIGNSAPLRVIQDTILLLGNGTIPCITLILGGNIIQGLRSSKLKARVTIGVICVRYLILPIIGITIVKTAKSLGFLPCDPLFSYVLMIQFTLPPAMNIGTMAQLFDVGQAECSVLFLWTYLVAAIALTGWSTIYMWILS